MSGQSNASYFHDHSSREFEAALNALMPGTEWVFGNGATSGSASMEVTRPKKNPDQYWWNDETDTPGSSFLEWKANADALAAAGHGTLAFTLWNQGEGDAAFVGASDANFERYTTNLVRNVFAEMRANAPGLRIFIQPLNRRHTATGVGTANVAGYEKLRDWHRRFAAENPDYVTLLPEMYDQPNDAGPHLTAAGYDALVLRNARKIAWTLGYSVPGGVDGPRLVAAVRDGADVVFEFAPDGGTGLMPKTGGVGLSWFVDGTAIALSDVTATGANRVSAVLATVPPPGAKEVAAFGSGIMSDVDHRMIIRDNQAAPLPVRHGRVVPTILDAADGGTY